MAEKKRRLTAGASGGRKRRPSKTKKSKSRRKPDSTSLHRLLARAEHQAAALRLANERLLSESARSRFVEEVLIESRRRFQNLIETLYDWVWEIDAKGHYTYVSPQVRNILGYEIQEVLGKTPYDLMPPEEAKRVSEKFGSLMAERKPIIALENVNLHKDGHPVILESNGLPFTDANGEFQGYRGTDRNITERKQAEDEARKSSEMVQLLLNSTAEAIYGLDLNGSCTFINAACLKILGYERPEQLLGKNMHDTIHYKRTDGTPYDVNECPIFRAFRQGKEMHVEDEVLWRKDGSSFFAEYWSYPIRQDGTPIGAVVTFLNITDRKLAETAIHVAAEEREKLIGDLQYALDNVKTLQGLIPICASCKKMRDDKGYWNQVEEYIIEHTDATFTHGICPDCARRMYGDLYESKDSS
jgi:PAS domain S-box-containing protein